METLTQQMIKLLKMYGATAVGIVTKETLAGGPPSTDIEYVLKDAKSAISFLVPFNQDYIEPYLSKKDRLSHEKDNVRTNTLVSGISLDIANYLTQIGFESVAQGANGVYRTDTPGGALDEKPPISHRYLAVRSGIGFFGLSGNVLTKEAGAGVILGSVITTAELEPTEPLPLEDNYCDSCRLCMAGCLSGYMNPNEKTGVTMGGVDFSYAKKRNHNRCDYVCGGFTGLSKSGEWSTWSPGRFPIPETDEAFLPAIINAALPFQNRPKQDGGFFHFLIPGNHTEFTCGNCAIICHPDKSVRKRRYKMLTESGVVVQNPDGSRSAVSPEKAQELISKMTEEMRGLYEA